jgi:hypothetical protein
MPEPGQIGDSEAADAGVEAETAPLPASALPAFRRPSYFGPSCPRCGLVRLDPAAMAAGPQACPSCGQRFDALPFVPSPPPPPAAVRSVAEAGPGGAVPCALHAGNAAELSCTRCGVLMCSLCRIDADGRELCPCCFERLRTDGELPSFVTRFPNYGGRALFLGWGGCLLYFLGILTGPATLYFAWKAFRQRRTHGDREGLPGILLAVALGILQMVVFVILVVAVGVALVQAGKT